MLAQSNSLVSLLSVLLLVGCGGSDDEEVGTLSRATIASFMGTYAITGYEINEDGCDSASDAINSLNQSYIEAYEFNFFGTYLQFNSCDDPAGCATLAADAADNTFTVSQLGYTLSDEVDGDHLTGFTAFTGLEREEGICSERAYDTIDLTREADGTVTIVSETVALEDKPTDSDGFCVADPDAQASEAAGRPCTSLEVITLTPVN